MKKAIYMLFITVGIILLLTPTCIDLTLKHYSNNIDIEEITAEKMEANNQRQAEFDFNAIRDVEISTVIDGVLNYDSELVIGTITIPDLDIYLPIMKGITNSNLLSGVATMKPDQVLGQGNYTVAGHYNKNKNILLGSLLDINIGSTVYLSDKKMVYEYQIYDTVIVPDTAKDMLLDEKAEERGKPILSIMTCYYTSKNGKRFFALGELINQYPAEKSPPHVRGTVYTRTPIQDI